MARDLDVVVWGASGFTGQRVLQTLISAAGGLRIGAAGRSHTRVEAAVRAAATAAAASSPAAAAPPIAAIEILVADASHDASLAAMASRARLVLACVGPFRLHGLPVARAAVAAGCDYLDICGEPAFIERVEHELFALAEEKGVFLASACGFDSIPADLGALFTQAQFAPPALASSVEAIVSVRPGPQGYKINFATYESAVLGVANAAELGTLRKAAARARAERDAALPAPPARPAGPRAPKPSEGPTFDRDLGAYTLPFPGADASVVRRTQGEVARRAAAGDATAPPPVYFGARFSVGASPVWAAAAVACGAAFLALAKSGGAWGRRLLLDQPALFSCGLVSRSGPTEEQMDGVSTRVHFVGKGYATADEAAAGGPPTKTVRTRVSLGDLGYKGTALILVGAALTLLEERGALEAATGRKGGVFTAGALFRRSSLRERLQRSGGARFEVVAAA